MDIRKICVVGGGQMGSQIALNAAISGFEVNLKTSAVEKVGSWAAEYLEGRVEKGRLTEKQVDEAISNFHLTNDLVMATTDVDLVIETIIEELEAKIMLFRTLGTLVSKDTILATNSSYNPSSVFIEYVPNPDRLINIHYFFPALVMQLVEICKGEHTANEVVDAVMEFAITCKKMPVLVKKETPGFIANSLLRVQKYEALRLVEEGYCEPKDVDTVLKLGFNHPMGIFDLMDMSGVDITYYRMMVEIKETGIIPPGFKIIQKMFEQNQLGKKTGRGFYEY